MDRRLLAVSHRRAARFGGAGHRPVAVGISASSSRGCCSAASTRPTGLSLLLTVAWRWSRRSPSDDLAPRRSHGSPRRSAPGFTALCLSALRLLNSLRASLRRRLAMLPAHAVGRVGPRRRADPERSGARHLARAYNAIGFRDRPWRAPRVMVAPISHPRGHGRRVKLGVRRRSPGGRARWGARRVRSSSASQGRRHAAGYPPVLGVVDTADVPLWGARAGTLRRGASSVRGPQRQPCHATVVNLVVAALAWPAPLALGPGPRGQSATEVVVFALACIALTPGRPQPASPSSATGLVRAGALPAGLCARLVYRLVVFWTLDFGR